MKTIALETKRIKLRQWRESDFLPFSELNADPYVMEYFPSTLTKAESDAIAERCQALIAERGWGLWVAELKESSAFMGFVGLHVPKAELPFSPCVEIGWRLSKPHWGYGYASEAARRALSFAFETLNLSEVVSFTATVNMRSRSVMERIGMVNTRDNFLHPDVPEGSYLSEHVLYKITRLVWEKNAV